MYVPGLSGEGVRAHASAKQNRAITFKSFVWVFRYYRSGVVRALMGPATVYYLHPPVWGMLHTALLAGPGGGAIGVL